MSSILYTLLVPYYTLLVFDICWYMLIYALRRHAQTKKIWPSPSPPDSPSDVVSFTVMYSSHSEPSSHRSSSQSHSCQASWTWQQIIDVGNPPVKLWKKNTDGSPGDPRFFLNKKSLVFMDVFGDMDVSYWPSKFNLAPDSQFCALGSA